MAAVTYKVGFTKLVLLGALRINPGKLIPETDVSMLVRAISLQSL